MPKRRSILQQRYLSAVALSYRNQFADAILKYQQILQLLDDNTIKSDVDIRVKASCYLDLAGDKVALNNYEINSIEMAEEIIQLNNDTLAWSHIIVKNVPSDYITRIKACLRLAMIYKGGVDDSIKSRYFNMNEVMRLAREIQSNYDKLKNCQMLKDFNKVRLDIVKFYACLGEYFLERYHYYDGKIYADPNKEQNVKVATQTHWNNAEYFILSALEILDKVVVHDRDDDYLRLRISIEQLAIDLYGNIDMEQEFNYYKAVIEDFKKIQHYTIEIIVDENDTYGEYTTLLCENRDKEAVIVAVNINLKAIERFACLLNSHAEPELIKTLYQCISKRFESIGEAFSYICDENSHEIAISRYAQLSFQRITDSSHSNFKPDDIEQLNSDSQHSLLINYNFTVLQVHELNTKLVMSLYARPDFPNMQLKAFLNNEENTWFFQFGAISLSDNQPAETAKADSLPEQLEMVSAPAATGLALAAVEPIRRYNLRKRKELPTYRDNLFVLMPDKLKPEAAKRIRTASLTATAENNLAHIRKSNR